jgi:tRNA dimethylallyltransferase
MMRKSQQLPLIVIVGPTASGKTSLAIKIAQEFDGEIISADSRAIYRGMDIGTAKPTGAEQKQVKHWGIDLVEPDERFTVADFQNYANEKIREIRARGKIPILVGGSGLYVDSVVFNYEFGNFSARHPELGSGSSKNKSVWIPGQARNDARSDFDPVLREKLDKMSITELQNYCESNNILLPENSKNKRYLVRAIERQNAPRNNRKQVREDCVIVGIETDPKILRQQIGERIQDMFNNGIEAETEKLIKKYPLTIEAMKSNIYPIVAKLLDGKITRDEAIKLAEIDDWHLAKKQLTWFRRNPAIKWLPLNKAENYLWEYVKNRSPDLPDL